MNDINKLFNEGMGRWDLKLSIYFLVFPPVGQSSYFPINF